MTDDEEISRIMQSVERAYGSWETPDYLFAQRALDSAEWEGLVEKLRAYADLGETTDFNSEVCRSFVIRKEGKDLATLQLSFVGPYGAFFRYEGPPDDIFIAGPDQARSELEAAIARTCAENGVRLLARRILEVPSGCGCSTPTLIAFAFIRRCSPTSTTCQENTEPSAAESRHSIRH